ncbi:MAG: hypothetical protein F4W90_03580 [Gammaproteobacteria bacterium]|nr:hypothetical protein [Gammaproteobacteria bacterium]
MELPSIPQQSSSDSSSGQNSSQGGTPNSGQSNQSGSQGGQQRSSSDGGFQLPTIPGLPDIQGESNDSASSGSNDSQGPNNLPTAGQTSRGDGTLEETDGADSGGTQSEQRSGDETLNGSQVGSETGTAQSGLPDAEGDHQAGGQEADADGLPGAGIASDAGNGENTDEAGLESAYPGTTSPNPGWERSNQLPEQAKTRAGGQTTNEDASGGLDKVNEPAGSKAAQELENTLAGLDGRIMTDRADEAEKRNEQVGGGKLPGESTLEPIGDGEGGTEEGGVAGVGGTSPDVFEGNAKSDGSRVGNDEGGETPTPRLILTNASELPDAKDDDVIARQLREAAIAETDPELKEKLWDELRRYLAKRK